MFGELIGIAKWSECKQPEKGQLVEKMVKVREKLSTS